jgi:mono/diheme cytochrome c family protein
MKSVRILFLIAASVLLVSGCAQTIVDREGVHEMRPETEDDWEFVRNSAISLAESANLVMVQGRPLSEGTPERGDDWNEYSENLITRALEAADAAQARDPDALFTAGSNIYEDACLACHEAYLPEDALPEL